MATNTKAPVPMTPTLKAQCIQEALDCRNAAAVARRHNLPPDQVRRWVRAAGRPALATHAEEDPNTLAAENRHLKEILGDKDLEIAILKDLIKKADRVPPRGVK